MSSFWKYRETLVSTANKVETEADVLFVVGFPDAETETIIVIPYWECDMKAEDLTRNAVSIATSYGDQNGAGHAICVVIDKRK